MISIRTRNLERVKQFIDTLPRHLRGEAAKEAAIYLIGNERRGLQNYPKQVPWTPYVRTQKYRFGFQRTGEGVNTKIVNEVPYAGYVRTRWAGMPWNWRTIAKVIIDNTTGMLQSVNRVLQAWIHKNEPK
jgi:hypothetical protein